LKNKSYVCVGLKYSGSREWRGYGGKYPLRVWFFDRKEHIQNNPASTYSPKHSSQLCALFTNFLKSLPKGQKAEKKFVKSIAKLLKMV
jgi:hypothetical protein